MLALLALGAAAYYTTKKSSSREEWDYSDKHVMITGGSRGLGLILARELAKKGARLTLLARNDDLLDKVKQELESYAAEVFVRTCDIRDTDDAQKAVDESLERFGNIDMLINNASIIQVGPYRTMKQEDIHNSMDLHLWAPVNLTEKVLPQFRRQNHGRIINIASIGGKMAVPHLLPYCVGKFALVGYSESLQAELAKENIFVTTVCPGLMRTGSTKQALFKGTADLEKSWFEGLASVPGISIDAERAARQILDAGRRAKPYLIVSLPARVAVAFHNLAPNTSSRFMSLMDRGLPSGDSEETFKGYETPAALPKFLTYFTKKAAKKNYEEPVYQH